MDLLTQVLATALDDGDDDDCEDDAYDDYGEEEDNVENEDGEGDISPPHEFLRQSYFAFAGFQKQFAC